MTKNIKVKTTQKIAAYIKENGTVLNYFETIEEGLKYEKEYQSEGISIGPVWTLSTENDELLDDAKGCYPTEVDALNHFKEIKYSHCSDPTDTEGHSYDCLHCGLHYSIFDEVEILACTVEKTI